MFIDDNSVRHILKVLKELMDFCAECENQTDDEEAWKLYYDVESQLENIYYDVATRSDFDEEEEELEDEEEHNE